MSTPVRAPQRTPARRPVAAPEARPDLRVVRLTDELAARRRLAGPAAVVLGGTVLFALLFGLAAFHTVLMQGQQRLDRLDDRVAEQQARYERQRLELARLEAPERIVADATTRLGMVPADGTTYLTPSGAVEAEIAGADPAAIDTPAAETEAADAAAGTAAWNEVKPYLGEAP